MKYRTIDNQWIELLDGQYKGSVYQYGKVDLIEEGETLRLKFEYFMKPQYNDPGTQAFKNYLGDILVELIEAGLQTNSMVYTGGTADTE